MSFGVCKGSQRPVKWSFALHSHRCSLVVLLWIHCNICTNLRRRNHCCRDELCSGSCAEPQPSMEPCQSPQMEACSVQRRALRTEDYICESFLILQWGDYVREGSCFFPSNIIAWALSSKESHEELHGIAEQMDRMGSARLWCALPQWGLAGWVGSSGKPTSPEIKDVIMWKSKKVANYVELFNCWVGRSSTWKLDSGKES